MRPQQQLNYELRIEKWPRWENPSAANFFALVEPEFLQCDR